MLTKLRDSDNLLFSNNDDIFGEMLAKNGGNEFNTAKKLLSLVSEGDTYVELGANYGNFMLPISDKVGPEGSVYVFEPSSSVYPFLLASVSINNKTNVRLENKATSDVDGFVEFSISDETDRFGSLGSAVIPDK